MTDSSVMPATASWVDTDAISVEVKQEIAAKKEGQHTSRTERAKIVHTLPCQKVPSQHSRALPLRNADAPLPTEKNEINCPEPA